MTMGDSLTSKRRDFLKILGVGTAAGLTSCSTTAPDFLVPYVVPPEEALKGHALWFASTCRECPAGCGVLARVRDGRVHKVEGNPQHPVNAGGLCARGQAAVQGLYNPDRLRTPLLRDESGVMKPVSWAEAQSRLLDGLSKIRQRPDAVGFVSGAVTGATEELIRVWLETWGSERHLRLEPIAHETVREANRLCFGIAGLPVLRFAEAQAVFVFGTDVLETFVSPVGYAHGIAEARRGGGRMVFVGSRLSLTGARADQWVPVPQGGEGQLAMALVREVLAQGGGSHLPSGDRQRLRDWSEPFTPQQAGVSAELLQAMARELREKPSLAVTGGAATCDEGGLATAVAVNLLNLATGAVNRTLRFDRACSLDRVARRAETLEWQKAMEDGSLQAVVIADANPAYSSPGFARALSRVPLVVALTPYADETVELAHIALPIHTPLESWGDCESWTGVHSLQQPTMRPVFDTRDLGDLLIETSRNEARTRPNVPNFREFLRARWRQLHQRSAVKEDFESFWSAALKQGGYWADVPERSAALRDAGVASAVRPLLNPVGKSGAYALQTYPSLLHFDGRGANRPWLQELPDPITQVVWDSWIEIHPKDAAELEIETGDRVQVRSAQGVVELPVYVYPGILPGHVAVPLGQGHTAYGRYATGVGVNAATLLGAEADAASGGTLWSGQRVEISRAGSAHQLVTVAGHDVQENRQIARSRTVPGEEHAAHEAEHESLSLYPEHEHKAHRWGMVIDLDACTGCSACVAACYSENNIPVVGKTQVARGREMSWIRMERFFGPGSDVTEPLQIDWTLMLCQQCDNAPCEPVCPVFAAYHTDEGLNGQVYNRCVGTRYCSNNCPYKVRRFNWFAAERLAPLDWQLNPDVTVRSKGVMEKCTFCVQRIVEGKDRARRNRRRVADGDIMPACAQSCPTRAIVFGDLLDEESQVSRLSADERRYNVLEELNTRPAVTYLERIRRKV